MQNDKEMVIVVTAETTHIPWFERLSAHYNAKLLSSGVQYLPVSSSLRRADDVQCLILPGDALPSIAHGDIDLVHDTAFGKIHMTSKDTLPRDMLALDLVADYVVKFFFGHFDLAVLDAVIDKDLMLRCSGRYGLAETATSLDFLISGHISL